MAASRIPKGEDPDFLARAKLPHDPGSFANLVREAFQVHHDCLQDGDIAESIGVTKGRISQILGKPELLKPETVATILEFIPSKEAKRQILIAWNRECFGLELGGKKLRGTVPAKFTTASLKRVDRLIREERLIQATELIQVGVEVVKEGQFRQLILDRAFWLYHKLNRPGSAAQIAETIFAEAEVNRDYPRMVFARLQTLRVLVHLPDVEIASVTRIMAWIESALHLIEERNEAKYATATHAFARRSLIATRLTLAERGVAPIEEDEMATFQETLSQELASAKSYQRRFGIQFLLTRILIRLGETFAAEEMLIKAFRAGDVKNLQGLEQCGIVEARIMIQSGNLDKATRHLRVLSDNCFDAEDFHHGWLAEVELADTVIRSTPD